MSGTQSNRKDPGLKAVKRLAREHDSEPEHAFHVATVALLLFDATADLHGRGEKERRVLEAASILHDTGYSVWPSQHHKGSRDLILSLSIDGFSKRERMMMACIARYHRKAHPQPRHKVFRSLEAEEKTRVIELAAILRIADGLDRTHAASVQGITVERNAKGLRIAVAERYPDSTDIWGAQRKCGLFEEVFGLQVEFVSEPEESSE